ncbi:ABC transporter ATP-binding protein [Solihabitans fulvus]|uniref:ABC transporter ATP-binding protein n=1 Tax=Solihabitans fulvus TaxID=1892852 RepID=A0A5B2WEW6_9PSEU|nr:ABC transporter ATP-binding protein [Solihabitans fulvus]KAA2248749.1 ABC transporter ATP-binding protein [Solihabitans fulvus]
MTENMLEVTGLGHVYRAKEQTHTAFGDISFAVDRGEIVCIVGPSGCGKSTLLRCLSGLLRPTSGTVSLHGTEVTEVPDELAMVFQDYSRSLFPWRTVAGNIEFPLRGRELSKAQRRERVEEALSWVGLSGAATKYPWQLSGGMQQRVAIARALAYRPMLMLMDEPFASVDAQTRAELEDLVLQVRAEHEMTVLLVTHDVDESVYLGDRVLVLSKSPASVVETLSVDLPAPRDQIGTRGAEEFVRLRTEVAQRIRNTAPTS